MRKFTKHLATATVSVVALALGACMSSGSNPASSSDPGYATVVIQTKTKNVDRLSKPGLGKSAAITLDSLIVTAISNASTPDTVIVKLGVGDSGFSSVATSDQNIGIVLNLKALRNWTISAKTIDVNDSIIQSGSVVTGNLFAGQTKIVTLDAAPNFIIYTASFAALPDSIASPTGNFKQNIRLTKLEMWIDGVKRADTSNTELAHGHSYLLSYDYVDSSAAQVVLNVFGTIDSAGAPYNSESLLYTDTVATSALTAVFPAVNTRALAWKGPVDGVADLEVAIQKVGTVAISGTTDHTVLNKKK